MASTKIEDIHVKTNIRNFDELFFNNLHFSSKLGSTFLIEGAAGSGKTTLSLQFACDFANPDGMKFSSDNPELKESLQKAKRWAIYYHLEEDHERLERKKETYKFLTNKIDVTKSTDELTSQEAAIAFISGDALDDQRQYWRERYQDVNSLDDLMPFEPNLRAQAACVIQDAIQPESDFDLMAILLKNALDRAVGKGPVVFTFVIDNLNSLDTFDILDEEEPWTIRQKYSYLRAFVQHYSHQLNENPNTCIIPLICIFVVDEPRKEDRSPRNQIEYVSDAYIRLSRKEIGKQNYSVRIIDVLKASNLAHIRGEQCFAIQPNVGINIYLSPAAILGFLRSQKKNLHTNVIPIKKNHPVCDEISQKLSQTQDGETGLIETSTTLIKGPVGSAKNLLALHFLDGISKNEAGLYFVLSDRVGMLHNTGKRFGLNYFEKGLVDIIDSRTMYDKIDSNKQIFLYQLEPSFMVPGCFLSIINCLAAEIYKKNGKRLSRLVIDNLSQFNNWFPNIDFAELFPALSEWLKVHDITSLFLHSKSLKSNKNNVIQEELFENIFTLKNTTEYNEHNNDTKATFELGIIRANASRYINHKIVLGIDSSGDKPTLNKTKEIEAEQPCPLLKTVTGE